MRPSPALAGGGRTVANLLSATEWMLPSPATQVHTISVLPSHSPPSPPHHFAFSNLTTAPKRNGGKGEEEGRPRFEVVRDDLLHPLANGNKARKLDALLPLLRRRGATDVVRAHRCIPLHPALITSCFSNLMVTCGGCQSAHAAATAVHCAEWGMRPHILLRGEQPDIPTGYNLISLMFGNVAYASRSVYAHRDEMLYNHARKVAGTGGTVLWADDISKEDFVLDEDNGCEIGSRRVVIIKEGAGDVQALLGVIRLVEYLYNLSSFHKHENVHVVVDAGTGTTAVGLALGAVCLGLHWRVTAVMLADTLERYKEREKSLISDFKKLCHNNYHEMVGENDIGDSLVEWVERLSPRRFGKVLNGEIALCRQIAQQTGILLDPMYTLAGWEQAVDLCVGDSRTKVMLDYNVLGGEKNMLFRNNATKPNNGTLRYGWQVGLIAINDGLVLRSQISRIFRRYFCGKSYYVDLLDLFNEVEFQTTSGQLLDQITTNEGRKDLNKYRRIVEYKTAYYSFYLPVACALLLFGESLDNYAQVKHILVEMGVYFQSQDDYLDCFGEPEIIGKENYGKSDPACVAKVKDLYNELHLQRVFSEYERESYEKLISAIEAQPNEAVRAVLKSFLHKIYKRSK
uniref:Uncharacterized protein n=1 Tax=Oryza nivara TaxID=4536 RepID=A0A0E0FRN6_ORYNI